MQLQNHLFHLLLIPSAARSLCFHQQKEALWFWAAVCWVAFERHM